MPAAGILEDPRGDGFSVEVNVVAHSCQYFLDVEPVLPAEPVVRSVVHLALLCMGASEAGILNIHSIVRLTFCSFNAEAQSREVVPVRLRAALVGLRREFANNHSALTSRDLGGRRE